jgi:hypothetical protein
MKPAHNEQREMSIIIGADAHHLSPLLEMIWKDWHKRHPEGTGIWINADMGLQDQLWCEKQGLTGIAVGKDFTLPTALSTFWILGPAARTAWSCFTMAPFSQGDWLLYGQNLAELESWLHQPLPMLRGSGFRFGYWKKSA